jgi:hypothetical protein
MFRTHFILIGLLLVVSARAQAADQIVFPGVSVSGIFDPSIADTAPDERAWMSYSAVDPSPLWPEKDTRTITTRLAYSDDHGASWKDAGLKVNDITEDPAATKPGSWINEVSSLVFDPKAQPPERWKLFWHHYLRMGEDGKFEHGWIGYKSAATPEGLRTAKEVKLFGAKGYNSDNNDVASAMRSPVGGPPLVEVHKLHSDLSMCLVLTEPGGMVTESGIYMSLSCLEPRIKNPLGLLAIGLFGVENRTILLKCDSPCHPEASGAWHYVSTLLTRADAESSSFDGYSAPDLYMENGKAWLIASLTSDKPVKGSYNGCHVFRIIDLETGKLEQDNRHPRIFRQVNGHEGTFNGACTYQPSIPAAGFLYGEIVFADRLVFGIYKTGKTH